MPLRATVKNESKPDFRSFRDKHVCLAFSHACEISHVPYELKCTKVCRCIYTDSIFLVFNLKATSTNIMLQTRQHIYKHV